MLLKLIPFLTITVLIYILSSLHLGVSLMNPPPLLSPQSDPQVLSASTNETNSDQQKANSYAVYGFLPYWLLNKAEYIPYDSLTHIAYFGIEFDDQGELMTHLEDGTKELGLHRMSQNTVSQIIRQSKQSQTSPILTVKILNNDGIEAAIDPENSQQVIDEILQITQQRNFSGINIDLEYINSPSTEIQNQFTEFIKQLSQQLNDYNLTPTPYDLTIDIYADTGYKQSERLWQLQDLAPYVDAFIVMGYDFHRSTTSSAGPVAPIHGAPEKWEEDLNSSLSFIMDLVPPEKIILGIPFYGYEWSTYTAKPNSATIRRSGGIATYTRVKELLENCNIITDLAELNDNPDNCYSQFDSDALSPYIIYRDGRQYQQIWYENAESLQYKLQYIKNTGMAGMAIWALGYDAPHPDLWEVIDQELK